MEMIINCFLISLVLLGLNIMIKMKFIKYRVCEELVVLMIMDVRLVFKGLRFFRHLNYSSRFITYFK